MEKVKLLNDGGYGDSDSVKFPVVVNGIKYISKRGVHIGYMVSEYELVNAGFSFGLPDGELYFSLVEGECVAVDE